MRMKHRRLADYFPVELSPKQQIHKFLKIDVIVTILMMLSYITRLGGQRSLCKIYLETMGSLPEGFVMNYEGMMNNSSMYIHIGSGGGTGIPVLNTNFMLLLIPALYLVTRGFAYYLLHRQGSNSIYVMRRLPDPWELWRRVLTMPLTGLLLLILQRVAMELIYRLLFHLLIPASCIR